MMLKKLISLIFISLFYFNFAYSEIVKKIDITGNERVNSETIKVFGGFKIGDTLDDQDLNEILKKLYETNFFENIDITLNQSVLQINVIENPIIQNLIIDGIKRKDLKKLVKDRISLKEKNPYLENKMESTVKNIKSLLQEVGYYFASVDLLKKENDNNTIDLIFEIDVGEKAFINEIVFLGDKKFKKRKLLNVITSEENKFWKFISSKRLLNKQRLELDKRLLLNFYKNKGYYQASILSETVKYDENQNFNIVFNIDSGNKFYFGNFLLDLPKDYDPKYFVKIKEKLNSFSGEKYSLKIVEKMLLEIEKVASGKQYEFINASIDEKVVDNNKLDVEIKIIDEANNFYVKAINIFGNNVTIEDVIRNELIIDEGDPLNRVLFNKSINNVRSLNIFENVSSEINDTDDENLKVIDIKVTEKATGQISLGAGVGTSGTSTSFGINENNFLGKGIKLNSNLLLSEEKIKGLFSYTKPNFGNSNKDLILSAESTETDRLSDYGYKSNDTGFLIGTSFEYLEDLSFSPAFSMNYESVTTASTASSLLKKQEGSYFDVEGSYYLFLDRRDQTFQPTDGYTSSFYQSLPFNTEDNQTIVNGYEFGTYHEYYENLVATLSIYARAANSFGDDDVRISDRLFIPQSKLRGFEAGKVGPIDGGDFVGGNYVSAFNATADLPFFENMETFDFNIFYDAANVWGVDYSSSINDSSALRSSTGIGVDWYTPIGPLSFSFSQPLTKKSTDKTETFRFNLGTTF